MKKVIGLLTLMSMFLQFAFIVQAEEAAVIYNHDLSEYDTGDVIKEAWNVAPNGTVLVGEEDEGKFVAVNDNNFSTEVGFIDVVPVSQGVVTVSFDWRNHSDTVYPGMFYIKNAKGQGTACLTIGKSPEHYNGSAGGDRTSKGNIEPETWVNISCVMDSASKSFKLYQDGLLILENGKFRDGNEMTDSLVLHIFGKKEQASVFDFKNLKVYQGEYIPEMSEYAKAMVVDPERTLVDFKDSKQKLDKALKNSVAMAIGNSVARVNNEYVNIYPGEPYVAPFISDDGNTLIPARFATEAIGCEVEVKSLEDFKISKDGNSIELRLGNRTAIINGAPVEMPTAPVLVKDRLFIPLRFAAETFGKSVFWDDRGLIVISDRNAVKEGQEEIIKPLLTEIRNYTTIFGNKKYSDVLYTSRSYYEPGNQWGTLDAAKRFMATSNRWTYDAFGEKGKKMLDQGLFLQNTLNANARDDQEFLKQVTTYFLGGEAYTRADGVNGTTWTCISNPDYWENITWRARNGIDNGIFAWQFDDWALNQNYRHGGCFCEYCVTGFTKYLKENVSADQLTECGISDINSFNYVDYLKEKGIVSYTSYDSVKSTPIGLQWEEFQKYRVREFHKKLKAYMEEYSGNEISYAFNAGISADGAATGWYLDLADGVMGETSSGHMAAENLYNNMLAGKATGIESVYSPLPKSKSDRETLYSAIPMSYATGQYVLVPWDAWLYGSTRYYATVEELGGIYELPREYPWLFDNYEIPEKIGYIINGDAMTADYEEYFGRLLREGVPAKLLIHRDNIYSMTFDENDFKGLSGIVAVDGTDNLSDSEKETLDRFGLLVSDGGQALENSLWTVRTQEPDVYTVLRQNQLYDNAPVVVHVVNYDADGTDKKNVKITVNNEYLPAGDSLTVNVYKPGENMTSFKAGKGNGTTELTVDSIDKWTILEISGAGTVKRDVAFNVGDFSGIGLGTRLSKDKAYGTPKSFSLVTYGEGINSTTYGDDNGTQDEGAFVYKRLGKSKINETVISAGFDDFDGVHGLMVRDGIYSNARFLALIQDGNGVKFAYRGITDKGVQYKELDSSTHKYLKLQRKNGVYYAYVSDDGKNYTEVGSYETEFNNAVGGVFAASPDGSRAECRINNLIVSKGAYPAEEFSTFKIRYKNGKIEKSTKNEKLEIQLKTENYANITPDDVKIDFVSSNPNIVEIADDGTIIPVGEGKATISATATMGLKKISTTANIEILPPNTTMYKESFDVAQLPSYINIISPGNISTSDGTLKIKADNAGDGVDVKFEFDQKKLPAAFEFDFRATFGQTSESPGARVLYGNEYGGISLIADKGGFKWFDKTGQHVIHEITDGKWYKIKVEAFYDEQLANVYINDKLVAEKADIRLAVTPNGEVQLGGWRLGTDTSLEWDNFHVYFID